jgi:hypothetical protein
MQSTSGSTRLRLAVALLLAIPGAVFIGQGLGIIRGSSFMVDDLRWTLIGLAMVIGAVAIAWLTARR